MNQVDEPRAVWISTFIPQGQGRTEATEAGTATTPGGGCAQSRRARTPSTAGPISIGFRLSWPLRIGQPRSLACTARLFLFTFALIQLTTLFAGTTSNLTIVSSNATPPTVGMEGRLEVILSEAGLTPKSPDRRAPLLLRIAFTRPHGTLTFYDLRYIGRVSGHFDLRDYLVTTNGAAATHLPALSVSAAGLLPTPHSGWLEEQALRAPAFFGSYRTLMAIAITLWVIAFFVILRMGRKPGAVEVTAQAPRPPTFAERIRPLVERAAAGKLSGDEKASLERLLIAHWQRRLGLREADGEELIARLREHDEAGALLKALEDWLHRPPGNAPVQIESVLAPYRNLPPEETAEVAR